MSAALEALERAAGSFGASTDDTAQLVDEQARRCAGEAAIWSALRDALRQRVGWQGRLTTALASIGFEELSTVRTIFRQLRGAALESQAVDWLALIDAFGRVVLDVFDLKLDDWLSET